MDSDPRVINTLRQQATSVENPSASVQHAAAAASVGFRSASVGVRDALVQNEAAAGRECWNSIRECSKRSGSRARVLEFDHRIFKTERQEAANVGIRSVSVQNAAATSVGIRSVNVQNAAAAGRECWNTIRECSKRIGSWPRVLDFVA